MAHEHDHDEHDHAHDGDEHGEHAHDPEEAARAGEREARRLTALAQIRQYGDPVLRMEAREVEIFDADLRRLAERMQRLMADARGVGLAATQVGIAQRVLVLQPGDDDAPTTVVNARIVEAGEEREVDDEGCLSLRGVHVPVERSVRVVLEGKDLAGEPLRLELEDLAARVAQHEVDHLDGVLIIDRTTPEKRREALATLRPEPALR